jgi:pyruvate/2-oxoglutarate dehydrogenase complex dihydrolipoamide acyltransferase (E2) component
MKNQDGYKAVPFPKIRQPVVDSLAEAKHMSVVHSLLEVDVTKARKWVREFRNKIGEPLSFTSFLTFCLAQAVDENKIVHAYRSGSKLIIYDQVDISVVIEREISDEKAPIFPHVIKAANQKTLTEIHNEIRAAQGKDRDLSRTIPWINRYYYLPGFIRSLLWRRWLGSPAWRKRLTGTVGISAIGMFGKGTGWWIPVPTYTLSITVGGISEKPVVVNGGIEIREWLSITASFDHNIVDGAPAARFTQRLKELIESGYGLSGKQMA